MNSYVNYKNDFNKRADDIISLDKIIVFIFLLPLTCQQQKTESLKIKPVPWLEYRLAQLQHKEGVIHYGETLDQVLSRQIADRAIVNEMAAAFMTIFDVRQLQPGKKYTFLIDTCGVVQGFTYYADVERTVRVLRDSTGLIKAHFYIKSLIKRIKTLRGILFTTLYDAIKESGENDELIVAFSDVFQWDIDFFTDPRPGNTFRLVYESIYICDPSQPDSLGDWVRYGRVLAGQYQLGTHLYSAVYFAKDDKNGGYYDLDGRSFQKTFLKSPLNYRRISSYFSGARRHPILKIVRAHTGVDFSAPEGTPVSAAADGLVLEKGYNSGLGNFIKIRHKNLHFVTVYGHLRGFVPGIEVGSMVNQRDIIGYVGSTGLSTGPHLHYIFLENGRPLNPLRIKNSSGDPIAATDMDRFNLDKEQMLMRLATAQIGMNNRVYPLVYRGNHGIGPLGMPLP